MGNCAGAVFPFRKCHSACFAAVSYTHLDVYKRQGLSFCSAAERHLLEKMEACRNFRLDAAKEMTQGIVPNPDVVSSRALENLGPETVRRFGIRRGDGVFVMPKGYVDQLPEQERRFLKPLYEPVQAGDVYKRQQ